jgi:hypothetical protein
MSCENVKQLRIKSSMLRRLRKEHDSYQKEVKAIENKISQMQADLQMLQNDEELEISIRKQVHLPHPARIPCRILIRFIQRQAEAHLGFRGPRAVFSIIPSS